jgi:hypothetical protein
MFRSAGRQKDVVLILEVCPKEVVSSPEGVHLLCDILQEECSSKICKCAAHYISVDSMEGSRSIGPTTLINRLV